MLRFEVLTVAGMKVIWNVAPCRLIETDCVLEVLTASIIRASTVRVEAVSASETFVNFYETTWRSFPKDSHLQIIVAVHLAVKH
jgi:hypothetical protein